MEKKSINVTPEQLGGLLFAIHTHAELVAMRSPDEIVYREDDLLTVLEALGLPAPIWGISLTVKEYLDGKGKY